MSGEGEDLDAFISVAEASRRLGITKYDQMRWVRERRYPVPVRQVGGRNRVSARLVHELLESGRRVEARAEPWPPPAAQRSVFDIAADLEAKSRWPPADVARRRHDAGMHIDRRVERLEEVTNALLGLVHELVSVIPDLGLKPSAATRLDSIGRRAEHLRATLAK